jgi:hypothetical protein
MRSIDLITSFDWTDDSTGTSLSTSPAPGASNEETEMSPTAVPSRITIDFRDTAMPSRTWILGVDEDASDRIELIAFDGPAPATDSAPHARPGTQPGRAQPTLAVPASLVPAAVLADCACPDFCERDHANE